MASQQKETEMHRLLSILLFAQLSLAPFAAHASPGICLFYLQHSPEQVLEITHDLLDAGLQSAGVGPEVAEAIVQCVARAYEEMRNQISLQCLENGPEVGLTHEQHELWNTRVESIFPYCISGVL